MKLLPGTEGDHNVSVEIDVIEQKTGIVTVGAGYSDSDGMVGIFELGDTNFRGTGDKVNLHWEFGGAGHIRNHGSIPTVIPWVLLFSTGSINTMIIMQMVIPLQNMIREEKDGILPGGVSVMNTAPII